MPIKVPPIPQRKPKPVDKPLAAIHQALAAIIEYLETEGGPGEPDKLEPIVGADRERGDQITQGGPKKYEVTFETNRDEAATRRGARKDHNAFATESDLKRELLVEVKRRTNDLAFALFPAWVGCLPSQRTLILNELMAWGAYLRAELARVLAELEDELPASGSPCSGDGHGRRTALAQVRVRLMHWGAFAPEYGPVAPAHGG